MAPSHFPSQENNIWEIMGIYFSDVINEVSHIGTIEDEGNIIVVTGLIDWRTLYSIT